MQSNTDIFDFKFVDRMQEKEMTEEFLQSSHIFLWIDGVHGVGKSFFIENYIIPKMKNNFEHVIYVNKSSNENNINYLSMLVENMSKELPLPFELFLQKHYTKWINIAEHVSKGISEFDSLKKISVITNALLNINGFFVSRNQEEHSTAKVLLEYLQDIFFNSSAYIILDNFSYCDKESFQIFEEMFVRLKDIQNIRFLICTTTEEREKNKELNILLCEKLSHTYILMKKFDDAKYFQKIMTNKFHMTKWLIDSIEDIYNLCGGIPDNLRNFVRQLYIDKGIRLQNDKFLIAQDKATELLYKNSIDFDPSKLQPNQRLVIQILALFGMPIPYDLMEDFIKFLNQDTSTHSFQFKLIQQKLLEITESLLQCQIITTQFYNGIEKLTFKHDNIYNALYNYYHEEKNAASVGYIHHLIYLYLVNHEEQLKLYNYEEIELLEAIATQSFSANEDDWPKYNRELAMCYYNTNKFYRCNQILSRFRVKSKNIDKNLILLMAEVFYEIAEYQSCIQELEELDINKLNTEEKVKYYILYGKAISFCDSQKAVENFENALKLKMPFEMQCQVEYYCEMSYSEIKNKLENAQDIFLKFYNNNNYRNSSVYASVLRSSVNIFPKKEAALYLNEGLKIAQTRADYLEEGKILNNLGFLYTRCEDYINAYKCFMSACNKLENIKPFEMSYPLTNIVFVQMTMMRWEKALDYIDTAAMYNKTDFIPYVLKTYKMICLIKLNKIDEALEIKEQLLEDINQGKIVDYKMLIKSKMNCAYVAYKIGDIDSKEKLLQECSILVKNSSAQNRYLNLCKKMDYQPQIYDFKENDNKYDLYDKIDFEPWVVTFGHD